MNVAAAPLIPPLILMFIIRIVFNMTFPIQILLFYVFPVMRKSMATIKAEILVLDNTIND